jgi:AraC family transcriptional regulator of adaptative response / DNA-3-methyladenine glycosylase II
VLNALGTRDTRAVAQQAQAWQPWRAYAVMRLWQSLLKPELDPSHAATALEAA